MKRCIGLALLAVSAVAAMGGKDRGAEQNSITVMAVWGDQEAEVFTRGIAAEFTKRSSVQVLFEGTRDINAVLTSRVQAGNPPDVAILPNPGTMMELAKEGRLVDLPKTCEEMLAVSRSASTSGIAPWAVGVESGAASGWVGTDWVENIFLRLHGPAKYKDWYEDRLAWTSPKVRRAFEYFGQVVADPAMAYSGKNYILSTNFGAARAPLFQPPLRALFHHQASFIQGFIKEQFPALVAGQDFAFFGFPSIDARYAKAVEGAGDCVVAFRPSPQVAAFL